MAQRGVLGKGLNCSHFSGPAHLPATQGQSSAGHSRRDKARGEAEMGKRSQHPGPPKFMTGAHSVQSEVKPLRSFRFPICNMGLWGPLGALLPRPRPSFFSRTLACPLLPAGPGLTPPEGPAWRADAHLLWRSWAQPSPPCRPRSRPGNEHEVFIMPEREKHWVFGCD